MTANRKIWAWTLAALFAVGIAGAGTYVWKRYIHAPWDEEYAYTKGVQAVVYSFPYVLNSSVRWAWSQPQKQGERVTAPTDAINNFFHSPRLTGADYRDGGTPNNDTVYSTTWAYVDKEPLVIGVPEIGNLPSSDKPRYYSFEISSFDSDNFAYIGTRTTGNKAGHYAIAPKGWKGKLPEGVTLLAEAPTPWFLILGRTLVTDQEDFPVVSKLIHQYTLSTLSDWQSKQTRRPPAPPLTPVPHYKSEQLTLLKQFWSIANAAMTANPPHARDERLMRFFSDIEVGPGKDVTKLSEGMQRGLDRAAMRGLMLLPEVNKTSYGTKLVNGWKYPPRVYGHAGLDGSFLTRAAMQSLGGIVANDAEEAVYIVAHTDGKGQLLDGSRNYQITFTKDKIPPVKAFWSMTIYDDTNNLVRNSLDRYSLGDRTSGMKYNSDGSLTLHISHKLPSEDVKANWLPAPEGEFYLVLRAYLPDEAIINQEWAPPSLEIVGK
ncbi:MAG: DUF1254 domain-containing protein [Rhodocyclaceae bacterium]|nr:DUF1254 domain-containing protein [Rhodocyclaceae bacterium]